MLIYIIKWVKNQNSFNRFLIYSYVRSTYEPNFFTFSPFLSIKFSIFTGSSSNHPKLSAIKWLLLHPSQRTKTTPLW